ncbi:PH domain-containing protein [Paenibacillus pini]|uniref:PH domain-containing protein n=1 Tax=Paenibacillus pini TaxID=669461 RepID=UPI00069204E8|nr:PH domain-containing protein [Paenibacillus pini]
MKFVPKRDLWLSITVWICIIFLVFAALSTLLVGGISIIGGSVISLVCLVIAGYIGWLWVVAFYVLQESELFIRFGPMTKSISYDSITQVKLIRSWMSSMATSSRRVEIKYGKFDFIHISPLDQKVFVEELAKRCHQASIEMNSL